jgi:hypothetical protein
MRPASPTPAIVHATSGQVPDRCPDRESSAFHAVHASIRREEGEVLAHVVPIGTACGLRGDQRAGIIDGQ